LLIIIIGIALAAAAGGYFFWTHSIALDAAHRAALHDLTRQDQSDLRREPMM